MAPRQDDLHHYDSNASGDYLLSYQKSMDEFATPRTKSHLRRFLYLVSAFTYALSIIGIIYHTTVPPDDPSSAGALASLPLERAMVILWMVGITTIVLFTTIPMIKYYSKSLIIRARHIPLTFTSALFAVLTAVTLALIYWNPSNCHAYNYPLGFFYLFSLLPFPVRVLRLLKVFVWKGGINDPMSIITFLLDYQEWTSFQQDLSVSIQQHTYSMKKIRQPITCIYCLHGAPHTYATTNHDENCGLNSTTFLFNNDPIYSPLDQSSQIDSNPQIMHQFHNNNEPNRNDKLNPNQQVNRDDELGTSYQGLSIQQHSTRDANYSSYLAMSGTTSNVQNSTSSIRTTSNNHQSLQSIIANPLDGATGQFSYNNEFSLGDSTTITQEAALHKAQAALHDPHSAEARRFMDRINGALSNFKDNFDRDDNLNAPMASEMNPNYNTLHQNQFLTDKDQSSLTTQHGLFTPQKPTNHPHVHDGFRPVTELKPNQINQAQVPLGFPTFSFTTQDSTDAETRSRLPYDFSFGASSITLQNHFGMGMGTSNPGVNNISDQYVNNALLFTSPIPLGNSSSDLNASTAHSKANTTNQNSKNASNPANINTNSTTGSGSGQNAQLQQQQLQFVQTLGKCALSVHENHQVLNSMMDNIRNYNNTHQSTFSSLQQTAMHKGKSNQGKPSRSGVQTNDDAIPVDLPPNELYRFTRSNECTCLSVYEASYFNEDNQLYTLYDYYSHNLHIELDIEKANEKNKLLRRGIDKLKKVRQKNTNPLHDTLLFDSNETDSAYHNDLLVPSDFLYDADDDVDPCPLHSYASETDRQHFQVDNFFDDGGELQRKLNRDLQRQQLRLQHQQNFPSSASSISPQDYIFSSTNPLKQFARCSTSNIIRISIFLLILLGAVMAMANYIIANNLTDDTSTYFCSETTKISQVATYIGASHLVTAAVFFLMVNLVHSVWSIYSSTAEYYVIIITHLILLVVQIASLIMSNNNDGRLFSGRFFFWSMSLRVTSTIVALLVTPLTKITQSPTPQLVPVDQEGNIVFDRSTSILNTTSKKSTSTNPSLNKKASKRKDQNTSPRLNIIGSNGVGEEQPKVMKLRLPKQVTDIRVYDLINRYVDDHMMVLTIELHRQHLSEQYNSPHSSSISSLHQPNHLDSQYLEGLDIDVFHELLNKPSVMDISQFHSITPQPPPSFDLLIRNPHGYSSFVSYLSREHAENLLHCYVHTQSILLLLHTVVENMQYILDIVARYNQHIKDQIDYEAFSNECDATSTPCAPNHRPDQLPKFLQPMITMQLYQLLTQLLGCTQSFSTLYLQSHTHSTSHPPTITVTHQPIFHNGCPHQPANSRSTDRWSCNYPVMDCVLCIITPYLSGSFVDANRSLMTLLTQVSQQQVQNLQLNEYTTAFNHTFNASTSSSSSTSTSAQQPPTAFIGSINQLDFIISSLDQRNGGIANRSNLPQPPQLFATSPFNSPDGFPCNDQTTPEFSSMLGQSSKLPPIQLTTQFSSHNPSTAADSVSSHHPQTSAQDIATEATSVRSSTRNSNSNPTNPSSSTNSYKPARFATAQQYQPPMFMTTPGSLNKHPTSSNTLSFIQPKDFSSILDKGNATSVLNRSYIARNQAHHVVESVSTSHSASTNNANNSNTSGVSRGSPPSFHTYTAVDRNNQNPTSNNTHNHNSNANQFFQSSSSNLAELLASSSSPFLATQRSAHHQSSSTSHNNQHSHSGFADEEEYSSSSSDTIHQHLNTNRQDHSFNVSASSNPASPPSSSNSSSAVRLPQHSNHGSKLLHYNMPLIDPEEIPFFYEQYCNFTFFSQVSQVISSLYALLKELESGSRNALCVHYSLYGSQSIHWKLLYYRIITINHWCNILHTCGLTEDLTL